MKQIIKRLQAGQVVAADDIAGVIAVEDEPEQETSTVAVEVKEEA